MLSRMYKEVVFAAVHMMLLPRLMIILVNSCRQSVVLATDHIIQTSSWVSERFAATRDGDDLSDTKQRF